jgi:hypothetical protein
LVDNVEYLTVGDRVDSSVSFLLVLDHSTIFENLEMTRNQRLNESHMRDYLTDAFLPLAEIL